MCGACSTRGEINAYRILVGKPKDERSLGRPGRNCEDNVKIDFNDEDMRMWIRIRFSGGLL
jgi:hypothetical protein